MTRLEFIVTKLTHIIYNGSDMIIPSNDMGISQRNELNDEILQFEKEFASEIYLTRDLERYI